MKEFYLRIKPYSGRIVLTVAAFVVGVLCLTIGFWRTLLLVLLVSIGYFIGKWHDGVLDVERIEKIPQYFPWR